MTAADLPLKGVRVLDLTLARAGPTCVRHLADWGADVIAVQAPDGGRELMSRDGFDYQNLHRNKRFVSLDLKSEAGHAAFLKLVATADVLVENMRAPVKHRLKIAYDDLKAVNPRLVYGSISGFGQDGPYAQRAGVDQIAQGMSGIMSVTGEPGRGPMRVGIAVSDVAAGSLLALGIMMALYQRQSTGEGRYVHTSLLESAIFLHGFPGGALADGRRGPRPDGQRPSDHGADGRLPDRRRPREHRRLFAGPVRAVLRGGGAPRLAEGRALVEHAAARREPRRAERRHRRGDAPAAQRTTGSSGWRPPASPAGRSSPSTRCSPTRR